MLSRDCDGCSQMRACSRRFRLAFLDEVVYCPDGTAHLIDTGSIVGKPAWEEFN